MYESPITLVENIYDTFKQDFETYLVEYINKIGITVNKEELERALTYDRDQYRKGFEEGKLVQPEIKTKGDYIRGLSDEKLAEYLWLRQFDGSYFPYSNELGDMNTEDRWLEWLKEEYRENSIE